MASDSPSADGSSRVLSEANSACHAERSEARQLTGCFLLRTKQKRILRADYSKVFKWRSALRSALHDMLGGFFGNLLV